MSFIQRSRRREEGEGGGLGGGGGEGGGSREEGGGMRRRRELCCTVSRKLLNAEKDERFNHQIIHPCNSNVFLLGYHVW